MTEAADWSQFMQIKLNIQKTANIWLASQKNKKKQKACSRKLKKERKKETVIHSLDQILFYRFSVLKRISDVPKMNFFLLLPLKPLQSFVYFYIYE